MRELKGNWTDLFNGFMLALDLRKMFLGFAGVVFSMAPLAATAWVANQVAPEAVERPRSLHLDAIWSTVRQSFGVIYCGSAGHETSWHVWLPHLLGFSAALLAIWAFFGGAIARIAAYEIAKDGERIETQRALEFSRRKFWSLFMAPWICVIGLGFFFACNFSGGFIGRLLDYVHVGGPLVAVLLPLALLSGFIMTLIGLGTIGGAPLFLPAVAAEGTDAFDAVSRGFSYVYSRPWHFLGYQVVSKGYGMICAAFVILFAITLCHVGLKAGALGFDAMGAQAPARGPKDPPPDATPAQRQAYEKEYNAYLADLVRNPDKYAAPDTRFQRVVDVAWGEILSDRYDGRKLDWRCPPKYLYKRVSQVGNRIVAPDRSVVREDLQGGQKVTLWIILVWMIFTLGLALGYVPSYCISQQTLVYFLLRKKVDGIEMNEVFEEIEEEAGPAESKPAEPTKEPEKK